MAEVFGSWNLSPRSSRTSRAGFIKPEKAEREAAAKAERKRERELEKLIRQQDKDLAKAERRAAKAAPPSDDDNLDIRKQPFARSKPVTS